MKIDEPFKQELARIVDFLNNNGEQSRKLWDVLSALRGPDSDNSTEKFISTEVIRDYIGLKDAGPLLIMSSGDSEEKLERRLELFPLDGRVFGPRLERWTHFSNHALLAFQALGLKWDRVNTK